MEKKQQKKIWRIDFLRKGESTPPIRFILLLFCIIGVFSASDTCVWAQVTTATLGGRVVDPHQHVIRGADVQVISEETGVTTHSKTNDSGLWQINSLIAGHYRFTVTMNGFETLEHTAIDLQIGDVKSIDVQMKVGSVDVQVVVSSETPLIDTTAAVSGVVLDSKDLEELPSISNSPLDLATMAPGVFIAPAVGGITSLWSNSSLSGFTVNGAGSSTNAVNYILDGATDTIVSSGDIAFIPPTDAVGQMRVMTNSYDASIGRTAAGTINLSLKSGTNQFHGVLYERNQNNFWNADYTQYKATGVPTPTIRFNEYGGTIGGPVLIPKVYDGKAHGTFFFFSYDGIRAVAPSKTSFLSIPNEAERGGDYSNSFEVVNNVSYPIKIYDPLTINSAGNRQAFPNSIIPTGRISPMAKALVALLPAPNVPHDAGGTDSNNYLENNPQADRFYSWIVRLDQAWNNSNHSYLDWRRNSFRQTTNDNYGPGNLLADEALDRDNYGLTLNHTWVINPKMIATINANGTVWKQYYASLATSADPTDYGFSQAFASSQLLRGIPQLTGVLGISAIGDVYGPTYENDYQWEARGFITQIAGMHSLRYGAEYLLSQESSGDRSGETGTYAFSSIWTRPNPNGSAPGGADEANPSFLLGLPSSGSMTQGAPAFWAQPFVGAYVQDDWRVTPNLTLDLGIRWDIQLGLTERNNQYFSRYDPNANIAPVTNYAQSRYASLIGGSSTNTGVAYLQQYGSAVSAFQAKGAIEYAGVNGVSRYVSNLQYKYIQPRVGFAYAFSPNTVLRGGAGRFTQANFVANHGNQLGYSATTPFTATNDNYYTTAATLDSPYPNGLVTPTGNSLGALTSVGSVSSFYNPDTKRQYTDDVSLRLQQQVHDFLFEIGGVFERTEGLVVGYQIDNPSLAAWYAAYTPTFGSNGEPVMTLAGNVAVTNPFKGAPYITSTLETSSTVSAYQLSRPNPLVNGVTENSYNNGSSEHYALQTRVQRRYKNGLGLLSTFTWNKQMDKTAYFTPSVYSQVLHRELSTNDRRFQFAVSPTYILPFGRGKLIGSRVSHGIDELIGGWEITAVYNFYSGTPISLPTNTAFFQGGDPNDGIKKSGSQWFNTSKFKAFPLQNTTVQQLDAYPAWTGVQSMPGYGYVPTSPTAVTLNGVYQDFATWHTNNPTTFGTVRNPYLNNWNIGVRKNLPIYKSMLLQLRIDAFNAFNHPQYGNVDTTPGDVYFGWLGGSPISSQVNAPRVIQLQGKLYF